MNTIKKLGLTAVLLSIMISISACGGKDAVQSEEKSFYEHGLEIISIMGEMAQNESYINYCSGNPALRDIIFSRIHGTDEKQLKAVYEITIPEKSVELMAGLDKIQTSDLLKKYIKSRVPAVIPSQINAAGGVETLAASNICTAGKTFLSDEIKEDMIYLYVYEDTAPCLICFVHGDNGTVSASGSFIFYEDFPTDTQEDIEKHFADLPAEVEKIK